MVIRLGDGRTMARLKVVLSSLSDKMRVSQFLKQDEGVLVGELALECALGMNFIDQILATGRA